MTISLDRIVNVSVTRATRTASRRSFASLMIVAHHTAWAERVREYTDVADILTDGLTEDHPAYLAAVAALSQSPRLRSVKIGRRVGTPTQTIDLTPTANGEGWVHSVTIGGETASYTELAGDDVNDICVGLAAAINALTVAVTAAEDPAPPAATKIIVTADVAGDWFAFTDPDSQLAISDDTAEPATTLATDLNAIRAEDANWYGLDVADAQSEDQITAIATWAEPLPILYFASTMDTDVEGTPTTDVHSVLKTAERLRTLPCYNRAGSHFAPSAAGMFLPRDPGSADIEFKGLTGVTPTDLSATAVGNILGTPESPSSGKRGLVYVEAIPAGTNAGTAITKGGLTSGGEWADVVIGLDFLVALIQERLFNVRVAAAKVPFTQGGIDAFAAAVRGAARTCATAPYNILDPETILVEAPDIADVDPADRQARYLDGVVLDARLQGAIRATRIRVTVRP